MGFGGNRTLFARICALVLAFLLFFGCPIQSAAHAVLAHEAIIDSAWNTNIRTLLVKRFPNVTADELKHTGMPMAVPSSRTWAIIRTEVISSAT
jgi:hypothetical protein